WTLFGWADGEFQFDTRTEESLGPPIVQIEIGPMIIEGTRRNDEWQQIRQAIPHDGLVLRPKTIFSDSKLNLKLRPSEWRVLSHINGRFTVRAVVNRSTMGNFEVQHILYQFLRDGIVEIVSGPGANGAGGEQDSGAASPVAEKSRSGGLLGG